MATGFKAAEHGMLLAQAKSIRAQMIVKGEETMANFGALTTDGLQGNAADSTQQLGQEFNTTMQAVDEVVQTLERLTTNFGDNMTGLDNNFAARIAG